MTWLIMTAAILVECGATLCLRMAGGLSRPLWFVPSILGYVVTFALVAAVLQRGWTMALTYGVWAGGGILLLGITGFFIFDEALRPAAVAGMFVTIAGIALMVHGSDLHGSARRAEPGSTPTISAWKGNNCDA